MSQSFAQNQLGDRVMAENKVRRVLLADKPDLPEDPTPPRMPGPLIFTVGCITVIVVSISAVALFG